MLIQLARSKSKQALELQRGMIEETLSSKALHTLKRVQDLNKANYNNYLMRKMNARKKG
jgi:hypothetical protein